MIKGEREQTRNNIIDFEAAKQKLRFQRQAKKPASKEVIYPSRTPEDKQFITDTLKKLEAEGKSISDLPDEKWIKLRLLNPYLVEMHEAMKRKADYQKSAEEWRKNVYDKLPRDAKGIPQVVWHYTDKTPRSHVSPREQKIGKGLIHILTAILEAAKTLIKPPPKAHKDM